MDTATAGRGRMLAAFGFLVAMALSAAIVLTGTPPPGHPLSVFRLLYEAGWWSLAAVVLSWALGVERLAPARLGLRRPTVSTLGWGLAFAAAQIGAVALCYLVLFPALGLPSEPARVKQIASEPLWLMALITLRAGLVEEWLFRFFAIDRVTSLTGSRWIASAIPGAIFVALHAQSWSLVHLIPVAAVTALLTVQYWWKRDLWGNALSHFLTDFIPFAAAAIAAAHR